MSDSASRALECTLRGMIGHARQEQSERGAAMMSVVYDEPQRMALARELAGAFLTPGRWSVESLAEAGAGTLDRWPEWMTALAMAVLARYRTRPDHVEFALVALIADFLAQRPPRAGEQEPPAILRLIPLPPRIAAPPRPPVERFGWPVAELDAPGTLAQRLELSAGQLAWLADVRSWERRVTEERLRNYRYRTLARPGGPPRVIEAPKARLKEIQRWLLREILDRVPPHDSAHGFSRGRSAITHAQLHTGQRVVIHLDLKDFFPSVSAGRVYAIWQALSYPPAVAHILTGLSTNVISRVIWEQIAADRPTSQVSAWFQLGRQLATPHLPQGAPTSPALANLAALGLDRRLSTLAMLREVRYSRYADDLAFSGGNWLVRNRARFLAAVAEIVNAEGFRINPAKTGLATAAGRQRVCGVVVNARPNVPRGDYDQLKAILHNAARTGPTAQNRAGVPDFRAHLLGRISWVEALNPDRGARLREMFDRVDWTAEPGIGPSRY